MNKIAEFEKDIAKLEAILENLQEQDVTLEKSIDMYADAAKLIADCNKTLAQAKLQIEEITASIDVQEG